MRGEGERERDSCHNGCLSKEYTLATLMHLLLLLLLLTLMLAREKGRGEQATMNGWLAKGERERERDATSQDVAVKEGKLAQCQLRKAHRRERDTNERADREGRLGGH